MKRLFFATVCVLLTGLVYAAKNDGSTCERAIEITQLYRAVIPSAGEYWYSAHTYDLPMQVSFVPEDTTLSIAPRVEVDFTCTGTYDDPRLTELFDKSSGSYVDMPYVLRCDSSVSEHGVKTYTLDVGDNFRTLLVQAGITHDLKAYVRVVANKSGLVKATPDTVSGACLRSSQMVSLGDTLHIAANDSDKTFTLPVSGWKHDSVRFVWMGQQDSLYAHLTTEHCDFSSADTAAIKEQFAIDAMSEKKYTADEMKELVDRYTFGGNIYYAHFISREAGELIVEKVPTVPGAGGAKTLRLGRATQLPMGDTTVYCFYKTWTGTSFTAPTEHIFRMYIGLTPQIDTADASSYIASYQFSKDAYGTHRMDITNSEMKALTDQALDNYLYVRFFCAEGTSILPGTLNDDCVNGSKGTFVSGKGVQILSNSASNSYYRLYLPDWRGRDIKFAWAGTSKPIEVFFADTCKFAPSASDPRVVERLSINARGNLTITGSDIEKWIPYIADPTGYIYLRLKTTNAAARFTMTSVGKQEEQEPEEPAFESLTVHVACDVLSNGTNAYVVSVSKPQELTLTMGDGMVVRTWYQEPKSTYTLNSALPSGTYMLTGSVAPNRPIRIEIP